MNDECKKLKTRFKKSKDFDKTCKNLKLENYEIVMGTETNENTNKTNKIIMIVKNGNVLITVHYNDKENQEEYKQEILYITY